MSMINRKIRAIHPGEILNEEFLAPLNLSQYRLAKEIKVPARRINEIIHGIRSITPDTALRLSRYFGMTPQFWLNLQNFYDVEVLSDKISGLLKRDIKRCNFLEKVSA